MKLLHCSDLHLGKRQIGGAGQYSRKRFDDFFNAFEYFVDYAIENSIKLMILTGDIFDKKELSPEVLSKTEEILQKAKINNINMLITEGNHDNINNESESWLIYLIDKGLALRPSYSRFETSYIFEPIIIDDIEFFGLGYMGAFANEVVKEFSNYLDNHSKVLKKIVLMHTAIINSDFLNGVVLSETINMLKNKVVYAGGGHIHSFTKYPADNPFFFTPGCPEFWDSDEIGKKKGAVLFDTDTFQYEFIPAKNRKVHIMKLITQSKDINELLEEISSYFNDLVIDFGEDLAKIDISSKNTFYIDFGAIEDLLSKLGILKTFFKYNPTHSDEAQIDEFSTIEDIEKEIIKGWGVFATEADDAYKYLKLFKSNYDNNLPEAFAENFDLMLDSIIEGVD
jgi:DNA repair protein SbcD/Mre11